MLNGPFYRNLVDNSEEYLEILLTNQLTNLQLPSVYLVGHLSSPLKEACLCSWDCCQQFPSKKYSEVIFEC